MSDDDFRKKLRSLNFPRKLGATETQPVVDERDGSLGGYHTVRWDGSQDANVFLKPTTAKAHEQGEQGTEDYQLQQEE